MTIAVVVTYKRWRRERPAPHHRRLIHKALMREVRINYMLPA